MQRDSDVDVSLSIYQVLLSPIVPVILQLKNQRIESWFEPSLVLPTKELSPDCDYCFHEY